MSIKNRLLFILVACSIFPMIFVGTLAYFNAKKALENTRIEALKSITYHKAKKIEDFFAEQKKHIRIAQRRPNIKKYAFILAGFSGDFPALTIKLFVTNWTEPLRCTHRFMIMQMLCWQIRKGK